MGRIRFAHTYNDIISVENLLFAWKEFRKGKRKKRDVQDFEICLTNNIFLLHNVLKDKAYNHDGYRAFNISDPKPRNIHKATVRDRLLHHAIYRMFYPFFDRTFISDSFSCRKDKGTHRAIQRFITYGQKASQNNTRTVFILKCDIRKFFASIDHVILFNILSQYIQGKDILWLIERVVSSFDAGKAGVGLPLGNLTSQLLVNVYMNKFDQFVKHKVRAKYYIRYADDFVVFSEDRKFLEKALLEMAEFLNVRLKLSIHPDKVFIKTLASGVDFLGWVHFPHHRVIRTATKKKMFRKLGNNPKEATLISYSSLLKHGDTENLRNHIAHSQGLYKKRKGYII